MIRHCKQKKMKERNEMMCLLVWKWRLLEQFVSVKVRKDSIHGDDVFIDFLLKMLLKFFRYSVELLARLIVVHISSAGAHFYKATATPEIRVVGIPEFNKLTVVCSGAGSKFVETTTQVAYSTVQVHT